MHLLEQVLINAYMNTNIYNTKVEIVKKRVTEPIELMMVGKGKIL